MYFNLNVLKVDEKTGVQHWGKSVQVLANTKLQEIDCIATEKSKLKIFKEMDELDVTATFEELKLEDGDTITVFKENVTAPGGPPKNLDNKTDHDICVYAYSKKTQCVHPIPANKVAGINIFKKDSQWGNTLVVAREVKKSKNGEPIYETVRYENIKMEASIDKLFLDNTGLYKRFKRDNIPDELINPTEKPVEMYKHEFDNENYGKEKKIVQMVKNTGETSLCLVSGSSKCFGVSPDIEKGIENTITIRKNSDKVYEFGIVKAEDFNPELIRPLAMFNAQECDKIEKIEIWKKEKGEFGADMVLEDGTVQPMTIFPGKNFRESDRITGKTVLGWLLPPFVQGLVKGVMKAIKPCP